MKRYFFGNWENAENPLSVPDIDRLIELAEQRRKEFSNFPLDKVWTFLDALRSKWADPEYTHRKALLQGLPKTTGFSTEMIGLALKEIDEVLNPEYLKKKLQTELSGLRDGSVHYDFKTQTLREWKPLGTILHVLSGNVFLVGIGSWIEGLITGNINILKMSSNETLFLPRLVESMLEVDKEGVISRSLAVIDYSSSQTDVMEALKKRVDGIVVWGGEDAVQAYRNHLPARTKIIVYGPKLSVAMVTNEGLRTLGPEKIAEKLAFELAIWDQNACTAPQTCFVEGEEALQAILEFLPAANEKWRKELPPGPAETHQAVEIQKWKNIAEIAESRGEGKMLSSKEGVDWTVIQSKQKAIEPSPLHRTIRLVAYNEVGEVSNELEKLKGYIQTFGLVCGTTELIQIPKLLLDAGVLRVHELGNMSGGEIDDPHDGWYDLPQFGHITYSRLPLSAKGLHPVDVLSSQDRLDFINRRLRELVRTAKQSPFYEKRLGGIEINSVQDLAKVAPLTREEMEAGMPPRSQDLKAREWAGGYVTRSGGSTGEPKYSVYDRQDWEKMVDGAVRILMAAGIQSGDRVANCMLAGDLYGSFVSFDHIHYRIGATTFAFAGHVNPENFLDVWKKWNLNVIVAMPTVIMPLMKVCKQMDKNFTMEKVVYAGTPLSAHDREWLTKNVGTKSVSSIIGANDGGQLAFQCGHLSGAFHHLIDDFNYVEILDDKNQPVPDGQPGKIVITSLEKTAFPLIRYEIGDAGKLVKKACACGRTTRIIEYLGRADDTLCVGLLNLKYADVISGLRELPLSLIQLAAQNNMEGEWLTMRVECETQSETFRDSVRAAVMKSQPLIEKRVAEKQLLKFEVVLFRPGEIPRNPRTGKVKLVLDERV